MASLRALLSDLEPPTIGNANKILYVKNDSTGPGNGGCCYLWTVPAGVTSATFEMYGAGGLGSGARCCERAGTMPTSGGYSRKTIDVVAAQEYRICAASSGNCTNNGCCGIQPRQAPSYVVCPSSGATVACAVGGLSGCSQMTRGGFCYGYICCHSLFSGGDSVGDITMDGTSGISLITCHCNTDIYTIGSNGWVGSEIMSSAFCAKEPSGSGPYHVCTGPAQTGGTGGSARACQGGFCYNQHSGGGLVKISYS